MKRVMQRAGRVAGRMFLVVSVIAGRMCLAVWRTFDLADVAIMSGMTLLATGLWMLLPAASLIVIGTLLLGYGTRGSWPTKGRQ